MRLFVAALSMCSRPNSTAVAPSLGFRAIVVLSVSCPPTRTRPRFSATHRQAHSSRTTLSAELRPQAEVGACAALT